jgi:hypothetical protein
MHDELKINSHSSLLILHTLLSSAPLQMRRALFFIASFSLIVICTYAVQAQGGNARRPPSVSPSPTLTRTTVRRETRRLGYGSALTILGAPAGSITIESWPRGEVEIEATIEVRADTEEDLARLAAVTNFVLDAEANHLRIITTGTHDRRFMRRAARDFPRRLLNAPWKIDYRIRVPAQIDLEIYGGRGATTVHGTEGAAMINVSEGDLNLTLTGGSVNATVGRGTVRFVAAARSWRGAGTEIRLAAGDLTVEFPANFNADIVASVAQLGRVENSYSALTPRDENAPLQPNERMLTGRAGSGGATLTFTIGAGTLRIRQANNQ